MPESEFFNDIVVQFRSEFIELTLESLNHTDNLIIAMVEDNNTSVSLDHFLHHIHSIKGQGGTFGFGTVTEIAQKLEGYVEAVPRISNKQINDIQCFVNSIRRIIENGVDPGEAERKIIFAALPVPKIDINDVEF